MKFGVNGHNLKTKAKISEYKSTTFCAQFETLIIDKIE